MNNYQIMNGVNNEVGSDAFNSDLKAKEEEESYMDHLAFVSCKEAEDNSARLEKENFV